MMPRSFSNSIVSGNTLKSARVETGTISSVNPRNLTVDWVSQYSGKQIADLQVLAPYYHFSGGEGFTVVPEVGAMCAVCFPSDDESPFVMGFLSGPERIAAQSDDLNSTIEDPGVNSPADVKEATSPTSTGSTEGGSTDATYRGARPILNPGDMYWQGRDENFVVLRRGGVLQIGATNICQRAYVPLRNFIRDFCENWELNSASGSLSWLVDHSTKDLTAKSPTEFTLVAREFAQDKNASVHIGIGSLDKVTQIDAPTPDKVCMQVIISPQDIDPKTGASISAGPVYEMRIDKKGNTWSIQSGTRSVSVEENDWLTVTKNQNITVHGTRTLTVDGTVTETIHDEHTVTGDKGSAESWGTIKSISAKAVKLGSTGASEPAVLGLSLIKWLALHTHPPGAPPAQAAQVSTLISSKVFVE